MEVDRVTVKVELTTPTGKTSIEASAALDFREGRTKEDAAAAAYNLVLALRDSVDAGAPPAAAGSDDGWGELKGSESWAAPRQPVAAAPPAGWCPVHQIQMKQQTNDRGTWWSHQHDGKWCKGS